LLVYWQVHILIAFRTTIFGPCPSFISALAPKFLKNLSDYFLRFHMNVQLPSWKIHSLHNSFFYKGSNSKLSTHCPPQLKFTPLPLQSIRLVPYQKNVWHLDGCNTNATAILCMLRLGHSKLNIDGHYNQICQCGSIKTKLHIFFECLSTYTSRQMLISTFCKILVDENIISRSEFTKLHRIDQNTSDWTSQSV